MWNTKNRNRVVGYHHPYSVFAVLLLVVVVMMMECMVVHAFVRTFHPSIQQRTTVTKESSMALLDNTSSSEDCIVIVGGGFGGLNAALSLSSLFQEQQEEQEKTRRIVLLDEKERFVFLPLLYELCINDASMEEVAPTYSSLLDSTEIEFVQTKVTGIDVEHNCIYTSESKMKYTACIVATGAELQLNAIPGAEHYALPFYTVDQCLELKRRFALLDSYQKKRRVVIVGGGYSGVELALNTLERFNYENVEVTLIHRGSSILENATPYNQQQGMDKLRQHNVNIITQTSVTHVSPPTSTDTENPYKCTIAFENKNIPSAKEQMDVDLLLWTAGASSTNRKGELGILNSKLPRDDKGRIVTGKYMRVKGYQNVFAIGDCARARKVPYAATAQVAMQQAPFAAWNLYSTLFDGKKMMPFSYLELGEMMTLGSNDATISSLQGLVQLNGPTASVLRRLIYSVRMPTTQQSIQALVSSSEKRILTNKRKQQKTNNNDKKNGTNNHKPIQWK